MAFVTVLIDDLCVWHAVGIGVAVVVLAWVNWVTDFTRSVVTYKNVLEYITNQSIRISENVLSLSSPLGHCKMCNHI